MHLTRAKVGIAGLAVVAAGVPLGSSLASGSPAAAKPAAGVIQLFASNSTATGDSPNKILIVGAFSDHGNGVDGTFHLKRAPLRSTPLRSSRSSEPQMPLRLYHELLVLG